MDRSEPVHQSEDDVTDDSALAQSRDTGGLDRDGFIGRVAGDDAGYAGETGAERRAQG